MRTSTGIYVEIRMKADMESFWRLTQEPGFHQRWDLRFTRIEYLPKASEEDLQRFIYETRIGFGLAIRGTGESVATRLSLDGSATSSLKFASEDKLSLISEGSGYWKYVPTADGLCFLTWYDYRTRYGRLGQLADAVFRPLMGWATAWSFDRLRLWAEDGITPETSMHMSAIHVLCRVSLQGSGFGMGWCQSCCSEMQANRSCCSRPVSQLGGCHGLALRRFCSDCWS